MSYQEKCHECGHKITAYTHSMNSGKALALRKLVDFYQQNKRPSQMVDLGLTPTQYTNFCHLKYFNLAMHIPEGWIPTETGIKFIHGEAGVINPVMVMKSEVLPDNHEAWENFKGIRQEVYVFDIENLAYKKRPAYQMEKAQTGLFDYM